METNFEHWVLYWTLQNYSFYPSGEYLCLKSPTFYCEKSCTNWEMWINNRENGFSVHLARVEDNDGPREVHVNCNMSVRNGKGLILLAEKFERTFATHSAKGMSAPKMNLRDILSKDISPNGDLLTIACDIFIFINNNQVNDFPCISLPAEEKCILANIYENFGCRDITLQASDARFQARKVFLKTGHSEKISELIDFERIPSQVVEKLLRRMHSDKFELTESVKPYIFILMELIKILKLSSLQTSLAAKRNYAHTEFEVESYELTWTLVKFNELKTTDGCIESPCLRLGNRTLICKVSTEANSDYGSNNRIEIQIELKKLCPQTRVVVKTSINTSCESEYAECRLVKRILCDEGLLEENGKLFLSSPGEKIFFEIFLPRCMLKNTLTLQINLKLTPMRLSTVKSNLGASNIISRTCDLRANNLENLCEDFAFFLEDNPFLGDMTLKAKPCPKINESNSQTDIRQLRGTGCSIAKVLKQRGKLRAYKALLAARSPVFSSEFENMPNESNRVFHLPDMEYAAMQKLLLYIYSGTFEKNYTDITIVAQVSHAAFKYQLPRLRSLCMDVLRSNLDESSLFRLLNFATTITDRDMKLVCFVYIENNISKVFATKAWEIFRRSHKKLAAEATRFSLGKRGALQTIIERTPF